MCSCVNRLFFSSYSKEINFDEENIRETALINSLKENQTLYIYTENVG